MITLLKLPFAVMYNLYLQLGVDGLRGLADYIEGDHVSVTKSNSFPLR